MGQIRFKENILIRELNAGDDIEELTKLLNVAYKPLADQGLRYIASHQDSSVTKERIAKGKCFIALNEDKIIATICYYHTNKANGCSWYNQPDVAVFGQFAVRQDYQKSGIGNKLLSIVENEAAHDGAMHLALDTAEDAANLIRYYQKRGYEFIEFVKWGEVNYRSVIMSKMLVPLNLKSDHL